MSLELVDIFLNYWMIEEEVNVSILHKNANTEMTNSTNI